MENLNEDIRENKGKKVIMPISRGKYRLVINYVEDFLSIDDDTKIEKSNKSEILNLQNIKAVIGKNGGSIDFNLFLNDLDDTNDPYTIIFKIEKNIDLFKEAIKSKLSFKEVFTVFDILRRLNTCSSIENVASIFAKTLQVEFLENVIKIIDNFNEISCNEQCEKTEEFFENIILYCENVTKIITGDLQLLLTNLFHSTENCLNALISKSDEGESNWFLEHLKNRLESLQLSVNNQQNSTSVKCLSVYPVRFMEKGKVEKNIISGSYKDVNQYLEIQFRLLKEDFEETIRNGIKLFREDPQCLKEMKNPHFIVYRDVTVCISSSANKNGHKIVFSNIFPFKNVDWEKSKYFMNGSLVLLSSDNFKRIYMATVKDRHPLEKNRNYIFVSFIANIPPSSENHKYVMLECTVFYEPYYQVMKALQNMAVDDFPMKKYIVSAEPSSKSPLYLNSNSQYEIGGVKVRLCDISSWSNSLNLNVSQIQAVKHALTSEFSLIQGPPGTGKTYICLKIIDILLANVEFLKNKNPCPILVVCLKNHALDQILGRLLDKYQNKQVKVLRLGGQSKIEDLKKKYNISKLRIARKGLKYVMSRMKAIENVMRRVQKEIIVNSSFMNYLEEGLGIVHLSILEKVISAQYRAQFKDGLFNWLFKDIDTININKLLVKIHQISKKEKLSDHFNISPNTISKFEILNICDTFKLTPAQCNVAYNSLYSISLYDLERALKELRDIINRKTSDENLDGVLDLVEYVQQFNEILQLYQFIKQRSSAIILSKINTSNNLDEMTTDERWKLYVSWERALYVYYKVETERLQKKYNRLKVLHDELNDIKKLKKVQKYGAHIIGATTTAAARYQYLLGELKPKIVIVEEAAEVLEAHVVASLSTHCEHVILIGDHQQLRPNPSSYRLANDFHLNVSLFERMIMNGMKSVALTTQHRMRPEISALISPSIYEKLDNADSVCKFPDVMGIDKNVYFINHNVKEDKVTTSLSKLNKHEGKLLISLCAYLLEQGYKPQDITILAGYMAQKEYMIKLRRDCNLDETMGEVVIDVVDNFQGEENRIIFLSLVRCNEEKNIGFLSEDNRVCVALSRAKEGLFIVGNMNSLIEKSKLWKNVNEVLLNNDCIGTRLPLKCKIHNRITNVSSAEDISKVLTNGCGQLCNVVKPCGHICFQVCHAVDIEHKKQFRCENTCEKVCKNGHTFKGTCSDNISSRCEIIVESKLDCGHTVQTECYKTTSQEINKKQDEIDICTKELRALTLSDKEDGEDISNDIDLTIICNEACGFALSCGHVCKRKCHFKYDPNHLNYLCPSKCKLINPNCIFGHKCNKKCYEDCGPCTRPMKKLLSCGHEIIKECHTILDKSSKCTETCKKKLSCGHNCKNICGEPCDDTCHEMVEQLINCGHKILIECNTRDSKLISSICNEQIEIVSKVCGHKNVVPCHVSRNSGKLNWVDIFSGNCKELCRARLACGHICTGTCGECVQGKLHKRCRSKCALILMCGHRCTAACSDVLHICKQSCLYKCDHKKCKETCGNPCTKICEQKCQQKCGHLECKKRCGEPCEKYCVKKCKLLLPCGHECMGFCGQKCPSLCVTCDPPSTYDPSNDRFIQLEDCGHMLKRNQQESFKNNINGMNKVGVQICRKCRTPIVSTSYFKKDILKTLKQINNIKNIILTSSSNLTGINSTFVQNLHVMANCDHVKGYKKIDDLIKFIVTSVVPIVSSKKKDITKLRSLYFITNLSIKLKKKLIQINVNDLPEIEQTCLIARVNLLIIKMKEYAFNLSEFQMLQLKHELNNLCDIVDKYVNFFKIMSTTSTNGKQFRDIKEEQNYCDDFVGTIFATPKRNSNNVNNKINIHSLDIPEELLTKTLHFGDWTICKKKHIYYSKYMIHCPKCNNSGSKYSLLYTL